MRMARRRVPAFLRPILFPGGAAFLLRRPILERSFTPRAAEAGLDLGAAQISSGHVLFLPPPFGRVVNCCPDMRYRHRSPPYEVGLQGCSKYTVNVTEENEAFALVMPIVFGEYEDTTGCTDATTPTVPC